MTEPTICVKCIHIEHDDAIGGRQTCKANRREEKVDLWSMKHAPPERPQDYRKRIKRERRERKKK